jgi:hypothetical protein
MIDSEITDLLDDGPERQLRFYELSPFEISLSPPSSPLWEGTARRLFFD